MRKLLLHLFTILAVVCLTACNDDFPQHGNNATDDGHEQVYTLRLAIDDAPATRSLASAQVGGGFKTRWCYGDKVTLQQTGSTAKHEFVIETPTGKQEGDPVTDRVATFTYRGTAISSFTNFTGKITYHCGMDKDETVNCGSVSSNKDHSYVTKRSREISCKRYALQTANDNAEHLKCLDNLSENITSCNLTQPKTITLKREFSILKIVLDDIYYPIFGGAILCVDGFDKSAGGNGRVSMVLGEAIIGQTGFPYTVEEAWPPRNADLAPQDPVADKGVTPFYDVSTEKDPITDYAVRDETHKLVAYIPLFEDYQMPANHTISICLRDTWAMDSYFWQTEPLKPFKLPLGCLYTIDLTQKVAGRYKYESFAAIHMGHSYNSSLGNPLTRNIGAKSITDPGDYFMFGYQDTILPGGHYPKYPKGTGYYYYKDGKSWFYYYNKDNVGMVSSAETPTSIYAKDEDLRLPQGTHTVKDWWKMWIKGLSEFPDFGMEWGLPDNVGSAAFAKTMPVLNSVVKVDGNPVGVRMSSIRTGHSVFLPNSYVLVPTTVAEELDPESQTMRYIAPDAVAQRKEDEVELAAVWAGSPVNVTADAMQISMYTFIIGEDNTTVSRARKFYDMNIAFPIRPVLYESGYYKGNSTTTKNVLQGIVDPIPK